MRLEAGHTRIGICHMQKYAPYMYGTPIRVWGPKITKKKPGLMYLKPKVIFLGLDLIFDGKTRIRSERTHWKQLEA